MNSLILDNIVAYRSNIRNLALARSKGLITEEDFRTQLEQTVAEMDVAIETLGRRGNTVMKPSISDRSNII